MRVMDQITKPNIHAWELINAKFRQLEIDGIDFVDPTCGKYGLIQRHT